MAGHPGVRRTDRGCRRASGSQHPFPRARHRTLRRAAGARSGPGGSDPRQRVDACRHRRRRVACRRLPRRHGRKSGLQRARPVPAPVRIGRARFRLRRMGADGPDDRRGCHARCRPERARDPAVAAAGRTESRQSRRTRAAGIPADPAAPREHAVDARSHDQPCTCTRQRICAVPRRSRAACRGSCCRSRRPARSTGRAALRRSVCRLS